MRRLVALLAALLLPVPAAAQQDTTAPVLLDFTISPVVFDTGSGPVLVQFCVTMRDDISGAASANIFVRNGGLTLIGSVSPSFSGLLMETSCTGFELPQFTAYAEYEITLILRDQVDNRRDILPAELCAEGLACSLENRPANDLPDTDGDGIPNDADNCPADPNPGQEDADLDLIGDVCDPFPNNRDNEQAQCDADLLQCLALPADPSVIFSSGSPNTGGGQSIGQPRDANRPERADDFTLAADESIDQIVFWTFEQGAWGGTVEFSFYEDDGGVPGLVPLATGSAASLIRQELGTLSAGTLYRNVLSIPTPLALPAGTYWLGLFMDPVVVNDGIFWASTIPGFGAQQARAEFSAGQPVWTPGGGPGGDQLAFELISLGGTSCSDELQACEEDLAQCQSLPQFSDLDVDGEHDATDLCPATLPNEDVDSDGCSLAQFCAAFDANTRDGRRECRLSDWRNDEFGRGRDCQPVTLNRRPRIFDCVPAP